MIYWRSKLKIKNISFFFWVLSTLGKTIDYSCFYHYKKKKLEKDLEAYLKVTFREKIMWQMWSVTEYKFFLPKILLKPSLKHFPTLI